MNQDAEQHIKSCHSFQVVASETLNTPLKPTPIPKDAWIMVGADLYGPFLTGEYLLIWVDYFS